MKPHLRYVFITLAIIPMLANASTDWTPFFKSMQNNCQWPTQDLEQFKVPANYQNSVVSKKVLGNPDDRTILLKLQNASAFGAPLTKVKFEVSTAGGDLTLYFANTEFMKYISHFHYSGDNITLVAGSNKTVTTPQGITYSSDKTGYQVGDDTEVNALVFNPQTKTIMCGGGGD